MDGSSWFAVVVSSAFTVLGAFGLAYWAFRAQDDRSARVGLYLLFGIPAGLLVVAGVATLVGGDALLAALLLGIGLGLGLPLLGPVRTALARVLPMAAESPVDMAGLCVILGAIGFLFARSLASPGAPSAEELAIDYVGLAAQAVAFVLVAYAAVGWRIVRSGAAATARLGIVRPDARTVAFGVGAVPVCLILAGAINAAANAVQPGLAEDLDIIVDQMTRLVQNPIGAVALGVSAGVGEEAIFRGAIQPRFGIVLTSILFAMPHAPQYGLNLALLGLVAVSVVLGLERKYLNTTAPMITHALYNAVVVMLAAAPG